MVRAQLIWKENSWLLLPALYAGRLIIKRDSGRLTHDLDVPSPSCRVLGGVGGHDAARRGGAMKHGMLKRLLHPSLMIPVASAGAVRFHLTTSLAA